MLSINTYEFTKVAEFHIDTKKGILQGVTIRGPGRDQRRYYAVKPMLNEAKLSLESLEEALDILELFNKVGYNRMIDEILPATIKAIGQENARKS